MRGPACLLAAALLAAGCAAAKRGGENAAVVATFPVHAVTTPSGLFMESYERDPGFALGTAPVLVPLYLVGDIFFTGVSAADAAMTPAYAPFPVRSLGIYDTREFPPRLERKAADATGTATVNCIVILSPFAAVVAIITGHGPWVTVGEDWPVPRRDL